VLHEARGDVGVRAFCNVVHVVRRLSPFSRGPRGGFVSPPPPPPPLPQLYIKALLNPFYAPGSRLDSPEFDARVKQLARRYLGYANTT
jgi:hypothetical protein